MIFGKVTSPENKNLKDLTPREKLILVPLVLLIFWIGIYPKPFFERIEPAVRQILVHIDSARMAATDSGKEIKDVVVSEDDRAVEAVYEEEKDSK